MKVRDYLQRSGVSVERRHLGRKQTRRSAETPLRIE